ncbi:MAG: hypothetical protein ACKN9S_04445, partial [Pirellula sp.]
KVLEFGAIRRLLRLDADHLSRKIGKSSRVLFSGCRWNPTSDGLRADFNSPWGGFSRMGQQGHHPMTHPPSVPMHVGTRTIDATDSLRREILEALATVRTVSDVSGGGLLLAL